MKRVIAMLLAGVILLTSVQIPVRADEVITNLEEDEVIEEENADSIDEVIDDVIEITDEDDIIEVDDSTEEPLLGANAAQSKIHNPRSSNGVVTWDCVYFGNYWQNDTNGDGTADKNDAKEKIKWRVLSVDGNDAFLIADQSLDCQKYNTSETSVTWKTCTLRSWLNGYGSSSNKNGINYSDSDKNFMDTAFSASEQSAIIQTTLVNADNPEWGTEGGDDTQDKIFLLSYDDAVNNAYGFSTGYSKYDEARWAKNTAYAKDAGAWTSSSSSYAGNGLWWLRSPGVSSGRAMLVHDDGYVSRHGGSVDYYDYNGVRPALHLNRSSSLWSYAGTVSSGTVETENISDILESVTYSYGSKNVDVLKYAHSVESKHGAFKLLCKTKSGKNIKKYFLVAGDSAISESEDGMFNSISPAGLENKSLYIVTEDSAGNKVKTPIMLTVINNKIKVVPFLNADSGNLKFTLDDDFPLIGGANLNLEIPDLPISTVVDDNKIRIGVNIADEPLKTWEDGTYTTSQSKTNAKKSYSEKFAEWVLDTKDKDLSKEILKSDIKDIKALCKKSDIQKGMPGIKGKVNWTCIGYFEAPFSLDEDVVEKAEGGLIFVIEASETWQKQFVVAYVPITLMATGKAECEIAGKGGYNFTNNSWYGEIPMDISVSISPYAGVGVGTWASAGVYGNVKVGTDLVIISSKEKSGLKDIYMSGETGLKAYFAKNEVGKLEILSMEDLKKTKKYGRYVSSSGKVLLYSRKEPSLIGDILGKNISSKDFRYDEAPAYNIAANNYTNMDLNVQWRDGYTEEIFSAFDGEKIGVKNAYPAAKPTLVSDDFMMYLREDTDSTVLSYGHIRDNKLTDVKAIKDDNTSDFGYEIYKGDDGLYVIYQNSRRVITSDDDLPSTDYAGSFGISVAKYNTADNTFVDLGSPDINDRYCYNPVLFDAENGLTAVWVENNKNDLLAKGETNSIWYSVFKNGSWSKPVAVAEKLNCINSLVACEVNTDAYLMYSTTGDTATAGLYLSKNFGNAERVESGNIGSIQFKNNSLYYNCDGGLFSYAIVNKEVDELLPKETMDYYSKYDVDGNKVYFTKTVDNSRGLYLAICNENNNDSGALSVIDEEDYIDDFSISGDTIAYLMTSVENVGDSNNINTSSNIYISSVPTYNDIKLERCDYYYGDATGDNELPLTMYIENNGTSVVREVKAIFNVDGKKQEKTVQVEILPGCLKLVETSIHLPVTLNYSNMTVTVSAGDESIDAYTDNKLDVKINRTELAVETSFSAIPNNYICEVNVANNSDIKTIANLTVTDADKNELLTERFEIEGNSDVVKSVKLADDFVPAEGDTLLTAEVSTEDDEYYYNNNIAYQRIWRVDINPEDDINDEDIDMNPTDYSLVLDKAELRINKGDTAQLIAKVIDSKGNEVKDADISWISYDENVATVNNGMVSAFDIGETVISAAYLGKKADCTILVTEPESAPEPEVTEPEPAPETKDWLNKKMLVSDTEFVINLATKEKLTIPELAKAKSDGKNYKIKYDKVGKKSDSQYAAMTSKGLITAKKAGVSHITLNKNGVEYKITVNVFNPQFKYENPKKKYFTVNTGSTVIPTYDDCKLKPTFTLDNNTIKKGLATINPETGEVTPLKKGTVKVTATVGGEEKPGYARKVTTTVKIYDPVINTGKKNTVKVGKTIKAKVKNGVKLTTDWESSNEAVATVDIKGTIRAISVGKVTITCVNNGKTISKEIEVIGN